MGPIDEVRMSPGHPHLVNFAGMTLKARAKSGWRSLQIPIFAPSVA